MEADRHKARGAKIRWRGTFADWRRFAPGVLAPSRFEAAWADELQPWIDIRTTSVRFGVPIDEAITLACRALAADAGPATQQLTISDAAPLGLDTLERALARPEPFAPHDAPFWDDPYIGRQMLVAHLDPQTDAASRRPETIQSTVDHLVGALGLRPGDRLLDLGCGPGLYTSAFAAHGLAVSGIDLSPTSVAYAVAAAQEAGLAIDYRLADYTREPLGGPFDATVLIYLDFGVLPDGPRDRLLDAIRVALQPGGAFAFDVHTRARDRVLDGAISVAHERGGFWRPSRHLVVETTYRYGEDLDLTQHAIIDAAGTITAYRVWDRAYSVAGLRTLLSRHGFRIEAVWSELTGTPRRRSSPTLAVVARRRPSRAPRPDETPDEVEREPER